MGVIDKTKEMNRSKSHLLTCTPFHVGVQKGINSRSPFPGKTCKTLAAFYTQIRYGCYILDGILSVECTNAASMNMKVGRCDRIERYVCMYHLDAYDPIASDAHIPLRFINPPYPKQDTIPTPYSKPPTYPNKHPTNANSSSSSPSISHPRTSSDPAASAPAAATAATRPQHPSTAYSAY